MEMGHVTHLPYHVQISLHVALESCVKRASAVMVSQPCFFFFFFVMSVKQKCVLDTLINK